jgi:hypothetical protein
VADNVKPVIRPPGAAPDYSAPDAESPYTVTATMELETVWHPKGL